MARSAVGRRRLASSLLTTVERTGDAAAAVADYLARHPRLPGFTTPVPGDVRTDLLRQACVDLHARRLAAADAVAAAGRAALGADSGPDLLFWGAVLLDHVGVPAGSPQRHVHLRTHGGLVGPRAGRPRPTRRLSRFRAGTGTSAGDARGGGRGVYANHRKVPSEPARDPP